jgi:hypothetical protein
VECVKRHKVKEASSLGPCTCTIKQRQFTRLPPKTFEITELPLKLFLFTELPLIGFIFTELPPIGFVFTQLPPIIKDIPTTPATDTLYRALL